MTSSENQPLEFVVRVDSAFLTDIGKKKPNNEDYAVTYEPTNPEDLQYSGCVYIVADGVGGAKRGEKASQYAADKVIYAYYTQPDTPPGDRLADILRSVGNEIYDYSGQAGLGKMATTMVAAVVRGDRLLVANVGDSRAYLIREGTVHQLTRDHNQLSELLRSGAMTPEEGRKSKAGNILTRSIGGHEDVDVDIFPERPIYPGDLIVLCSDGLHRYLDNETLLALVKPGEAEQIAQRLVKHANQSGGADNITALVIAIHGPTEPEIHPHTPMRLKKPEPIDQMKTEIPAMRSQRRKKTGFQRQYLLFAVPVLLVLAAAWFVSGPITKLLAGWFPGAAVRATETLIPTVDTGIAAGTAVVPVVPGPAETMTPSTVSTSPETAGTPTLKPLQGTGTPDQVLGVCVHEAILDKGISHILALYSETYYATSEYYYFTGCDDSTHQCNEPASKPMPITDQSIFPAAGYLWIEAVNDQAICENQKGIWIFSPE